MEEEKQEAQKTLVSFVVGLLIGGMLVWAFSGPTATAPDHDDRSHDDDKEMQEGDNHDDQDGKAEGDAMEAIDEPAVLEIGDGSVSVSDQPASASIELERAIYPVSEGWIGVREYNNGQLGFILGVVRFSEEQGLVPSDIVLQRATTPGKTYAVVIFEEDGDRVFNLAGDVQIDTIFDTFVAR